MNICVFCEYSSSDWDCLKKHLMQHMQLPYLCNVCDDNVGRQHKIVCSEHTGTDHIVFDCEELDFSMFWVWNFIEYAKVDLMKYMKKPLQGCVVCKNIAKLGGKHVTDNLRVDAVAIRDHLKSHLRYYRYYCNECKFISSRKNVVKHIIKCHEVEDVERVVRQGKPLTKLEQLISMSRDKFLVSREKYLQNCPVKVNGTVTANSQNSPAEEVNCSTFELSETNRPPDLESNSISTNYENSSVKSHDSLSNQISDFMLKECSVRLSRLSNEEIEEYKAQICHKDDNSAVNNAVDEIPKYDADFKEKDEEVEIPEPVADDHTETEGNQTFICIFCNQTELKSYEEAYKHYQIHLDYYPLKCSLCDEVNLSLKCMLKHFRAEHENETKAIFQRCENEIISKWIQSFLTFQMKSLESFPIKSSCPVCELLHKEVVDLPLYQSTPKKLMVHILKHICYEPFICVDCWSNNVVVTFIQLDTRKVYTHIFNKHREKINADLSTIIKKNRKIILLEKFIKQYLLVKGIEYKEKEHARIPNFVISTFERRAKEREERVKINSQNISSTNDPPVTIKSDLDQVTVERKAVKKSVASPSLVIDISPSFAQVNDENPYTCRFFCVFCESKTFFSSKLDACSHIAEHLNYYPVVCLFCSSKFADLKSLMSHHAETHANTSFPWGDDPSSSLLYVVNEDEEMEKWIEEFLDFQTSSKSWNLYCASFKQNCPVCKRLLSDFPSSFTCFKTDSSFQQHIHHHLNYYPYECILCKNENKSTRLPLVDGCASHHLLNHGINCGDSLNNFFLKTTTIKAVELLISEAVVKNSLSQSCSDKILNLIESSPQISSNSVERKEKEYFENVHPSVTGVISVSSQCEALTNEVSQENSVRCYHCQVVLKGWLLLKEHHFRIHPGLSLIGY